MADPVFQIGESGLKVAEEQMKSLMNKMVNSETPGFKGSDVLVISFPMELEAAEKKIQPMVPKVEGTFYNHLQGALIKTDKQTDLAIGSKGYFVILGSWGEGYTRDGRFKVDEQGHLLTEVGGYPLLGQSGPIEIPAGSQITITQNGEVIADKSVVDRIRVVEVAENEKQSMVSLNGSIFKAPEGGLNLVEVEAPRVVQGYVEGSNVNVVNQTMDMIVLQRLFSIETKLVQTRDANLSKIFQIGKTAQ